MKALGADGLNLEDLRRMRKHRKGHTLIPFAMAEHCALGYRNIAMDAALGKPEAYGPFLRMMDHAHTIMQPAKDEVARAQDRVPIPATFILAPNPDPSAADEQQQQQPPVRPTAPGILVDANGQEYVAG